MNRHTVIAMTIGALSGAAQANPCDATRWQGDVSCQIDGAGVCTGQLHGTTQTTAYIDLECVDTGEAWRAFVEDVVEWVYPSHHCSAKLWAEPYHWLSPFEHNGEWRMVFAAPRLNSTQINRTVSPDHAAYLWMLARGSEPEGHYVLRAPSSSGVTQRCFAPYKADGTNNWRKRGKVCETRFETRRREDDVKVAHAWISHRCGNGQGDYDYGNSYDVDDPRHRPSPCLDIEQRDTVTQEPVHYGPTNEEEDPLGLMSRAELEVLQDRPYFLHTGPGYAVELAGEYLPADIRCSVQ